MFGIWEWDLSGSLSVSVPAVKLYGEKSESILFVAREIFGIPIATLATLQSFKLEQSYLLMKWIGSNSAQIGSSRTFEWSSVVRLEVRFMFHDPEETSILWRAMYIWSRLFLTLNYKNILSAIQHPFEVHPITTTFISKSRLSSRRRVLVEYLLKSWRCISK